MRRFLRAYFYQLLVVLVVLVLAWANWQGKTYLLGWDSLQTELNPLLGVKRAWFSVWEEYQSFGLVAGMAHAADLLRALFIVLLSIILPQNQVRYVFHFLMIGVGALGMYKALEASGLGKERSLVKVTGAVFYILNLATIQIMGLPFESFSVFLASLPWLIWVFWHSLDVKKLTRKDLFIFALINLLATPSFVSQQLFLVYLFVLGLLYLGLLNKTWHWVSLRRGIFLAVIILLINSFWLLPQAYFLKSNGQVVRNAKINQMMTEDIFYRNLEKGELFHFARLEGFFYDTTDAAGRSIFQAWHDYRNQPMVSSLIWIIVPFMLLGLFSKNRHRAGLIFLTFFLMTGLLLNTPVFREINLLYRQNSLVNQLFRSPFTKFAVVWAFVAAYLFAQGVNGLINLLAKIMPKNCWQLCYGLLSAVSFSLIILVSLPAFTGYYFVPEMRVGVPQDYFELMEYFKTVPKERRIALLPDYTYWGWFFTKWGYNGSGFLWYGIEQPIVSRNFDYWSSSSESYFWEIKRALEAEDIPAIEKVLVKYHVNYLVLDKSLLPVSSTTKALQTERLENLFWQSEKIKLIRNWENLGLYEVNLPSQGFIELSSTLPNLGPRQKIMDYDVLFANVGNYQTSDSLPGIYAPFLGLFSQTAVNENLFTMGEIDNSFVLSTGLPENLTGYSLQKSGPQKYEFLNQTENPVKVKNFQTVALVEAGELNISFPKLLLSKPILSKTELLNCGRSSGSLDHSTENGVLHLYANDGATFCFGYSLSIMNQRYGYLVKVDTENIKGRPLFLSVIDDTKKQVYFERRLQNGTNYFFINPRYKAGLGYDLNFSHDSYEGVPAENILSSLDIYLFPYNEVIGTQLVSSSPVLSKAVKQRTPIYSHLQYHRYEVELPEELTAYNLLLFQEFNEGWKAYVNQKELPHTVVNNWANGWRLRPEDFGDPRGGKYQVTIVFWPQYLQFAGFALLALAFLGVLLYREKRV